MAKQQQKHGKRLSPSVRKFIRKEKARLKNEITDKEAYAKKVSELYKRFKS